MKKGCKISLITVGAFIGVFILLVILVDIFVPIENESEQKAEFKEPPQPKEVLNYSIAEKYDYTYPGIPRMGYRLILLVPGIPPENQMEELAVRIWKDGNKHWKEFAVWMFMPETFKDPGIPFYRAVFNPKRLKESHVQYFALIGTKWEQEKEMKDYLLKPLVEKY